MPVVYIQNFYSKEELNGIMTELHSLTEQGLFFNYDEQYGTGSAVRDGVPLKNGKGLHLDGYYDGERDKSQILKTNRKLFSKEVTTTLESYHTFYRYVGESTEDNTKIHYFNEGNHYKRHIDSTCVTAITYFHDIPKTFTGGELIVENSIKVPCLNNSLVIFPSILWHEVTPVVGTGRYAMSQFLSI